MPWLTTHSVDGAGENYCVHKQLPDAIARIAEIWTTAVAAEIGRQITEVLAKLANRNPADPKPECRALLTLPKEVFASRTGIHGYVELRQIGYGEWFGCLADDDLTPPPQDPVQ